MNKVWSMARVLLRVREKKHRWVYIVVLCNFLFLILVPAFEPLGRVPFFVFPIAVLFVIQYWRPTVPGWFVLLAILLVREMYFFHYVPLPGAHKPAAWFWLVVWDLVPIGLLLWAFPRATRDGHLVTDSI
jgi:hypothetical protein